MRTRHKPTDFKVPLLIAINHAQVEAGEAVGIPEDGSVDDAGSHPLLALLSEAYRLAESMES